MTVPPFDTTFAPKHTTSPNAAWNFGEPIGRTPTQKEWLEGDKAGWKSWNTVETDPMKLYPLMLGGIVPRPVAFVSTVSTSGVENLACYSWFQMISFHPPSIIISPANAPRRKDTTQNILDTKQFTVNIISEPFVENANACAIDAPEDFNEWPLSGLTREPSTFVKPARVKESAFSMECELLQAIDVRHPEYDRPDLGDGLTTLIIGVVRYIHARKDVLNDQELVDVVKPQPVSRLGDISFGRVGNLYRLKRYKWEEEKENIKAALKQ